LLSLLLSQSNLCCTKAPWPRMAWQYHRSVVHDAIT
jgi:hypothetical protein